MEPVQFIWLYRGDQSESGRREPATVDAALLRIAEGKIACTMVRVAATGRRGQAIERPERLGTQCRTGSGIRSVLSAAAGDPEAGMLF